VNPQYSGEQSTSLMFSDAIGVMLLTHDHYRGFTQRPIGDARRESHALLALSVDSRDAVNATFSRATAVVPTPIRCRVTASCSAAASKILTATSGKSCGWTPARTPRRLKAPDPASGCKRKGRRASRPDRSNNFARRVGAAGRPFVLPQRANSVGEGSSDCPTRNHKETKTCGL
jgi:hypothetical protein